MLANPTVRQDRARLEHLVDRVLGALLPDGAEASRRAIVTIIHQARAASRAGDTDGAMAVLDELDMALAPRDLACWAYAEWLACVRRRYTSADVLLYRAGTGQAAVLKPTSEDGTLRALAVLGLRWQPGQLLSRRCLRGLKPLHTSAKGGPPWPRE